MNILKAVIMGIVQGFTEFLPVSSSGHLAIIKQVLGVDLDGGIFFDILLHFGTLISILFVFYKDIWHMLKEFAGMCGTVFANFIIFVRRRKGDTRYTYIKIITSSYRKLVLMILISTIPTGILGIVGKDFVEWANHTLWFVGICLMVTAALLIVADHNCYGSIRIKEVPYASSFLLGIAQGVATLPGISRSGATITTGLLLDFDKRTAVKYSFLMSIPAILGAVVIDLKDLASETLEVSRIPGYAVGTVTAALTGLLSLNIMLKLIRKKRYFGFAVYCAVLGLIAIIFSIIKKQGV